MHLVGVRDHIICLGISFKHSKSLEMQFVGGLDMSMKGNQAENSRSGQKRLGRWD